MGQDQISAALLEELASIEHERWAHWQKYLHSKAEASEGGGLLLPADLVKRWEAQIATKYSDLSETEKESDREQVRKYLPVLVRYIQSLDSKGNGRSER